MGENSSMSPADIIALMGNRGFGSGDGLGWLILILLFLGGFSGWGNRGPGPAPTPVVPPNVATTTDVQTAVNNQTVNSGIQQILLSSANNNYETAQLVSQQTNALQQQNYANQINAIQGFNNLGMNVTSGFNNTQNAIMAQTNALQQQISQLGYQMDQCCCSIKTQMLQDRLDDRNRQLAEANDKITSMQSANYILGNAGRFVAWAGSGSATASNLTT